MAVVVQTEAARKTKGPVRWKIPRNYRREVMRRVVQAETLSVTKASVHFYTGNEIFRTEITVVGPGFERKGTAGAQGIGELPGFARQQIFGNDGIQGDVPSFECARKQKLHFQFVIVLFAQDGVGLVIVGFCV